MSHDSLDVNTVYDVHVAHDTVGLITCMILMTLECSIRDVLSGCILMTLLVRIYLGCEFYSSCGYSSMDFASCMHDTICMHMHAYVRMYVDRSVHAYVHGWG